MTIYSFMWQNSSSALLGIEDIMIRQTWPLSYRKNEKTFGNYNEVINDMGGKAETMRRTYIKELNQV